jgi:hypothetical protein
MYMSHPEKIPKRGNCTKPRETVRMEPTQISWFSGQSDGRLDLVRGCQRPSKLFFNKKKHFLLLINLAQHRTPHPLPGAEVRNMFIYWQS